MYVRDSYCPNIYTLSEFSSLNYRIRSRVPCSLLAMDQPSTCLRSYKMDQQPQWPCPTTLLLPPFVSQSLVFPPLHGTLAYANSLSWVLMLGKLFASTDGPRYSLPTSNSTSSSSGNNTSNGNGTPAPPPITSWSNDIALSATASASSSAPGQPASAAIDSVVGGYLPTGGDVSKEWSSNRQGAGAWLQLVWPNPVSISSVVLYDRINLDVSRPQTGQGILVLIHWFHIGSNPKWYARSE